MLETRTLFASMHDTSYLSAEELAAVVDVLQECEEAVTGCSTAMLRHADPGPFAGAVLRDIDCADVVGTTRRVLTRRSGPNSTLLSAQLEACLLACEQSNELCSRYAAEHEHCRICSEATRRCAQMCQQTLTALHT